MTVDIPIIIVKMIEVYRLILRSCVVMQRHLTNHAIQIIEIHPNNMEAANVRGRYPTSEISM